MGKYNSIIDLVGNTPLLLLSNYGKEKGSHAAIYGKLEFFNPTGSSKDRVAKNMILTAEKEGKLIRGVSTIIEPTSGNTGIGLAAIGVALGYKVIIVMPSTMSLERRKLIAHYGAKIVLSEGALGMAGAVRKAKEIAWETPHSFIAGQFDNPANPESHYLTTGPEIINDLGEDIAAFVAGIGTGGTLSGTGKYLKEKVPGVSIIGVEPSSSPLLTKGTSGPHAIQGIGANFVPENLNKEIYDQIIPVSNEDALLEAKRIARIEGINVGISSGAALYAGALLASHKDYEGKNIVVLLPDSGDRYLSTPLFEEE